MDEQEFNARFNFEVKGLPLLEQIKKQLEAQGLSYENLRKATEHYNREGTRSAVVFKAVSAAGKEVSIIADELEYKNKRLYVSWSKDLLDVDKKAQSAAAEVKKLMASGLAVPRMPKLDQVGSVEGYTLLKERLEKLVEVQRKVRLLDIESPEGKAKRKEKLAEISRQIQLTRQAITVQKEYVAQIGRQFSEQLKQAEAIDRAAEAQRRLNMELGRIASTAIPQGPSLAGKSAAEDYLKQKDYIKQLIQAQRELRATEVGEVGANQNKKIRLNYLTEEIRKGRELLAVLKEELELKGQQALRDAALYDNQQRLLGLQQRLAAVSTPQTLALSGNYTQKLQQLQAFLERELLTKKELVNLERQYQQILNRKVISPQQAAQAKNALATVQALRQQNTELIKNVQLTLQTARAQDRLAQSGQHAQDIFLNLGTAFRVFQFILLHRVFYGIAYQIMAGVKAAAELSIRIGEIETISNRVITTTQQWNELVRQLSDTYAQTLAQTAEGVYEAVSNQVVKSAQDLLFLEQNMKLATITVSSFEDAINSTTAVINAFGKSTADVESIAGVLFKTVDLGRIRLSEMANTIGRTSALASKLGVTFEEQSAALADMTIKGVQHNNAQTYLVNIFQKMIRPSERMLEIYQEWGVTSGEQAIRTFGFAGAMEKLLKVAEESGDEMAELGNIFQRIRATTGASILSTEGMAKALDQFKRSTLDAKQAFDLMYNTVGMRWRRALTELQNLFTQDIGRALVEPILNLADAFGGLSNLVLMAGRTVTSVFAAWLSYKSTLKVLPVVLGLIGQSTTQAAVATISLANAQNQAAISTISLNMALKATALTTVNVVAALVGLAVLIGSQFYISSKTLIFQLEESARAFAEKIKKIKELSEEYTTLYKATESYTASVKDSLKYVNQLAATLSSKVNKALEKNKETYEWIEKRTKRIIQIVSSSASTILSNLEKIISDYRESIKKATEGIHELGLERLGLIFEQNLQKIGFWGNEAVTVMRNRGAEIQKQVQNLARGVQFQLAGLFNFKGIKDPGIFGDLRNEYLKLLNVFQRGITNPNDPKNVELVQRAIQNLYKEYQNLERQLRNIDEVTKRTLAAQIKYADQVARQAIKNATTELAKAKTPEEAETARKRLDEATKYLEKRNDLIDKWNEEYETNITRIQQNIIRRHQEELAVINLKQAAEAAYIKNIEAGIVAKERERATLEKSYDRLKDIFDRISGFDYTKDKDYAATFKALSLEASKLTAAMGIEPRERFDLLLKLQENYNAQVEKGRLERMNKVAASVQETTKDIDLIYEESNRKIKDYEQTQKTANLNITSELGKQLQTVEQLYFNFYRQQEIFRASLAPQTDQAYVDKVNQELDRRLAVYNQIKELITAINANAIQTPAQIQTAVKLVSEAAIELRRAGDLSSDTAYVNFQNLRRALLEYNVIYKNYQVLLKTFNEQIRPINQEIINLKNIDSGFNTKAVEDQEKILKLLQAQAAAIRDRSRAAIEGIPNVPNRQALGGYRRGNDRRMVVMDPREFIVNAEASRTYRPILEAINSNRVPRFASGGGPVTNVGDINVRVEGGQSNTQTVREIAQGINREIRLGRIKLNVR